MKNGTVYAGRVKKAFAKMRASSGKVEIPEPDDPLYRLMVGVLGVGCSEEDATRAVGRASEAMVDWNEARVSSAFELNQATGNAIPQGVKQCQRAIRALQSVFDCENRLSLDRLKGLARREARQYLAALEGADEFAVASVVLWSLGGHAIPVNDRLLGELRKADLVHPDATRAEVQAFLERHVSAADAKEFCIIMRSFKASEKKRGKRAAKKSAVS